MSTAPATPPVRLLVCDDHAVVRAGLLALLASAGDIEVVGEASNGEEAVALAARLVPQVVLMDLQLGEGIDGVEATRRITAAPGAPHVLVLTTYDAGPGAAAHRTGAGDPGPAGAGPGKPGDRPRAVHQRGDGEDPSGPDLRQVGRRNPSRRGGRGRRAPTVALSTRAGLRAVWAAPRLLHGHGTWAAQCPRAVGTGVGARPKVSGVLCAWHRTTDSTGAECHHGMPGVASSACV